jgi:hypothetical protein
LSPCELIRRKSVGDVKKGKDVRGKQDNGGKESWKNSIAERFVYMPSSTVFWVSLTNFG